jgi:hypothetical protein
LWVSDEKVDFEDEDEKQQLSRHESEFFCLKIPPSMLHL